MKDSAASAWLEPFIPRPLIRNGHVQTIAGNFLPRRHSALPAPEARVIEVESATSDLPASHVLATVTGSRKMCVPRVPR